MSRLHEFYRNAIRQWPCLIWYPSHSEALWPVPVEKNHHLLGPIELIVSEYHVDNSYSKLNLVTLDLSFQDN